MVWGVVYDFMSFCTVLYGKNFEESEMSIAESRLQLSAEISEHAPMDFHFKKLIHVFLNIAKCSNGILANAFIPKMINNHDEDSDDENDMNDRNDSNDYDNDEDADDDTTNQSPSQKRQCNRMSVFKSKQDSQTFLKNTYSKEQIYIDDDYDKVKILKSSESTSSLKVAKYNNINDISLFDTRASRSGTNNKNKLNN